MILDTFVSIFEADTEELRKGYDQAKKSTEQMSDSLKKVEDQSVKTTESIGSLAKKAAGFFLAYVAANSSISAVVEEAASIRALDNLSNSLNDSIENVDAFSKSMQNIGVSKDVAEQTLTSVYSKMKSLGINANSATDAMLKLSDKVSRLDDKKAKEYLAAVGITDPRMIEQIRRGKNSLQDMMVSQKELGVTTKESAENALAFDTAVTKLNVRLGSIKSTVSGAVMPAFTFFLNMLSKIVDFLVANKAFTIGFFTTLATIIAYTFAPAMFAAATATWAFIAPILAIVAPILLAAGAIALLVDDIYNFIQGNDSLIGRLLEAYPEIKKFVDDTLAIIYDVVDGIKEIFPKVRDEISIFVNDLVEEMTAKIKEWKDGFSTFVGDAVDSVIGFFKDMWSVFEGIYNKIIAGFEKIVGIKNKISDVSSTASTAVLDAFGAGGDVGNEVYDLNELRRKAGWVEDEEGNLYDPKKRIDENITTANTQLQSVEQNPLNSVTSEAIKASNVSNETKVSVGDITINTQATDADQISQAFRSELESQLESLAQENNTGVIK